MRFNHHVNIKYNLDYYELFNRHNELLKPITIGGDHSISMATVGSSLQKHDNLKVLWIDAHADINTPVSTLLGQSHLMNVPIKLKRDNLGYIGLRDIDNYEYKELETIRWYSSKCVHNQGVGKILNELNYSENDKIHISLDVDALDPKYFPATGAPVANGLNPEHVYKIIHLLKKNIVSLDIVEYNPLINDNYECKRFILNCIRHKSLLHSFLCRHTLPSTYLVAELGT